jgi:hypothetical protein
LDRIARIVGWIAVAWFALAAGWGVFATVGGGHYAAAAATAISAENMVIWKIIAPYWEWTLTPPPPSQYYCHHPFFSFWVYVPFIALFGHHSWYMQLPPVLMSAATALLINRTAHRVWGPLGAAAATAGFVMLPICLAYSNFNALEVPTIFGWSLFFWGHTGLLRTWKRRYILASAVGAAVTATADWIGYVVPALMLGWTMLRIVLPPRIFPPIKVRRYAQWWIACCFVTCAFFGLWFVLFWKYGTLIDLLGSAATRSSGVAVPLADAIEARRYRVDICFTPFAILIGKIAAPIAFLRLLARRRDEEAFSIACLIAATIQYVGFKQGADVHVFWPHYFGIYFAFAFAQLVLSLDWALRKLLALTQRAWAERAAYGAALGVVALYVILMIPDALRGMREGRETWGRYNEERIRSDADAVRVIESVIAPRLPPGATLDAHSGVRWSWHYSWATHGLHQDTSVPKRGAGDVNDHPFFFARLGGLSTSEIRALASDFHLEIYGDVLVVDRRRAPGPLDAYVFEERSKNPFSWYFLGATEPGRTVSDPFATWEWRTHLGQDATPPNVEPVTPEQIRIAHNVAVASGDMARAQSLRERLEALLSREVIADYTQGIKLLGVHKVAGVGARYDAIFFAGEGPTPGEAQFGVHARVVAKSPLSWVRPDPLVRDLSMPMTMPANLWKRGMIYACPLWLFHRTGVETYETVFWSRDGKPAPERVGGPLDILTLR